MNNFIIFAKKGIMLPWFLKSKKRYVNSYDDEMEEFAFIVNSLLLIPRILSHRPEEKMTYFRTYSYSIHKMSVAWRFEAHQAQYGSAEAKLCDDKTRQSSVLLITALFLIVNWW